MNTEEIMNVEKTNSPEGNISFETFVTSIPKLAQALYSDSVLYFADGEHIAIEERKKLITTNIQLLRERFNVLERALS